MTSWHGSAFSITGLCEGNPPITFSCYPEQTDEHTVELPAIETPQRSSVIGTANMPQMIHKQWFSNMASMWLAAMPLAGRIKNQVWWFNVKHSISSVRRGLGILAISPACLQAIPSVIAYKLQITRIHYYWNVPTANNKSSNEIISWPTRSNIVRVQNSLNEFHYNESSTTYNRTDIVISKKSIYVAFRTRDLATTWLIGMFLKIKLTNQNVIWLTILLCTQN